MAHLKASSRHSPSLEHYTSQFRNALPETQYRIDYPRYERQLVLSPARCSPVRNRSTLWSAPGDREKSLLSAYVAACFRIRVRQAHCMTAPANLVPQDAYDRAEKHTGVQTLYWGQSTFLFWMLSCHCDTELRHPSANVARCQSPTCLLSMTPCRHNRQSRTPSVLRSASLPSSSSQCVARAKFATRSHGTYVDEPMDVVLIMQTSIRSSISMADGTNFGVCKTPRVKVRRIVFIRHVLCSPSTDIRHTTLTPTRASKYEWVRCRKDWNEAELSAGLRLAHLIQSHRSACLCLPYSATPRRTGRRLRQF